MSDQEALLQHGKKTILSKLNNNNNKQHLEEHRDKPSRSLELSHISNFFYPTTLKSVGYYVIPSVQKFAFECPSFHQHFVSALYLEHLLTDFLQTLYKS